MFVLENNYLRVEISEKGAELKSIYNKINNKELLWESDPKYWAKSSPVLFPVVGALKDDCFIYEDKKYYMSRHGFARDMNFSIIHNKSKKMIFEINSDSETKKSFPFDFKLHIIYELNNDILNVIYTVFNTSLSDPMYFSLGAHPAFALPDDYNDLSNYNLYFNKDTLLTYKSLKNNLVANEEHTIILSDSYLNLNYKLFSNDVLIIDNMKSNIISLHNKNEGKIFSLEFHNFPYFGIWSIPGAKFICLEPWSGIADIQSHDKYFFRKKGINRLNPQKKWKSSWSLQIPQI